MKRELSATGRASSRGREKIPLRPFFEFMALPLSVVPSGLGDFIALDGLY